RMGLVRCGSTCGEDTAPTFRSAKLPVGKTAAFRKPRRGSTKAATSITPHFPSRVLPRPEACTFTHLLTEQIHFCWKLRLARESLPTTLKFRGGLCCSKLATGQQVSTEAGRERAEVLTNFSFGEGVATPCTRRVPRLGESGVFGVFPV